MDNIKSILTKLKKYNKAYRKGIPLVSDNEYDTLVDKLKRVDPDHDFLHHVEPEKFDSKKEVTHPQPMLSIAKAYLKDDIIKFANRVKKSAKELNIVQYLFKITPKLDGLAGRYDGKILATRGNGYIGYDISDIFTKGVIPVKSREAGLGEIVILKSYFSENLADKFEHPRNMVVGIVSSNNLNHFAQKAIQDQAVRFVSYSTLSKWEGKITDFIKNIEKISKDLISQTDYPTDGLVIEVNNDAIKTVMGATSHHYRWQIAFKEKGETKQTSVKEIIWQVGRTGNVTPVLIVDPIYLSGATIKRVTAHHAGLIKKKNIGIGAILEIIRSGEVIPKIEKIIKKADNINIPAVCPSCQSELKWHNDFLKCHNTMCNAQIEKNIYHWFKTLGNADWFGEKTVQKLVSNGFDNLIKIYEMSETDFINIGFGPIQSKNLNNALNTSISKSIEDWRFVAALGIPNLGIGDSRKLLSNINIEKIVSLKAEDIEKIDGFGAISSKSIEKGINNVKKTLIHLLYLGFNLSSTPLVEKTDKIKNPIAEKRIVFTGKMSQATREEMQNTARKLGATPQSSVSGKTDFLVCGDNVGIKKMEKARQKGIQIISESKYLKIIEPYI